MQFVDFYLYLLLPSKLVVHSVSFIAQSAGVDLNEKKRYIKNSFKIHFWDANGCLLYTSDAADE